MPYLSTMLGKRIENLKGEKLGRLEDVVAEPGSKFPVVKGIVGQSGWGRGRRRFFVPWECVENMGNDFITVSEEEEAKWPSKDDVLLARDLLDKQIVDMDGYKIVRVSDVRIAKSGNELRVLGADVGLLAILRRLGLNLQTKRLKITGGRLARERIVPWNLVSPVGPMPYDVRLRVPYRKFLEIHPSDIADIIEQLDEDRRSKVLALIEDPKAAEVLTHILPGMRSSVAEAIGDERLSDLLEIMPPDEAADILGALPREKAQALLSLMGIREASVVGELLGFDPETAGGRMTTEFVAMPNSMSASDTIESLRRMGAEAETIYYVYVVDTEGHLSGVLSLRDLLRSSPEDKTGNMMTRDVITVDLEDDQELVAEKLSRYKLLALPVVDSDFVLKGIVTVDDVIDVVREESTEDLSHLLGISLDATTMSKGVLERSRWAGTILTFLGGVLATALFGIFKAEFTAALALVYFVPLALRSVHDVSIWSLVVSARDIEREPISPERMRFVLAREYVYSLAAALVISVLGLTLGMIWTRVSKVALAGGLGLFTGVAVSGVLGLLLPMVLRRVRPELVAEQGKLAVIAVMAVSVTSFLVVSGLMVRAFL